MLLLYFFVFNVAFPNNKSTYAEQLSGARFFNKHYKLFQTVQLCISRSSDAFQCRKTYYKKQKIMQKKWPAYTLLQKSSFSRQQGSFYFAYKFWLKLTRKIHHPLISILAYEHQSTVFTIKLILGWYAAFDIQAECLFYGIYITLKSGSEYFSKIKEIQIKKSIFRSVSHQYFQNQFSV